MLGLFRLLGFRTVRWAKIDKELRDTCERYGEPVMQAFITAPAGPQARDLQKIFPDAAKNAEVAAWLTERGDIRANAEWRLELVQWAALAFAFLAVAVGVLAIVVALREPLARPLLAPPSSFEAGILRL
jgi:hypothetical protein